MSPEKKKQGFAALTPDKHREASSKGGRYKGPKGFASLSEQQRKENSVRAAQVRWAKVRAERKLKEHTYEQQQETEHSPGNQPE